MYENAPSEFPLRIHYKVSYVKRETAQKKMKRINIAVEFKVEGHRERKTSKVSFCGLDRMGQHEAAIRKNMKKNKTKYLRLRIKASTANTFFNSLTIV